MSSVPDDTNGSDYPDGSDRLDDLVGPSRANNLDELGRAGLTNLTDMTDLYGPLG